MSEKLPVSYALFLHAILGLHLRRLLSEKLGVPERDVFVWPVRAYCFQSIVHEHVVVDGIPITNVIDNPVP